MRRPTSASGALPFLVTFFSALAGAAGCTTSETGSLFLDLPDRGGTAATAGAEPVAGKSGSGGSGVGGAAGVGGSAGSGLGAVGGAASGNGGAPNAGSAGVPTCASNAECGDSLPLCDTTRGTCAECLDAAACELGDRCTNGLCLDPCDSNTDCTSGDRQHCTGPGGGCAQCLSDADCQGPERCGPLLLECVECVADTDCVDPGKPGCLVREGRCEECSRDEHCSNGQVCEIVNGRCR